MTSRLGQVCHFATPADLWRPYKTPLFPCSERSCSSRRDPPQLDALGGHSCAERETTCVLYYGCSGFLLENTNVHIWLSDLKFKEVRTIMQAVRQHIIYLLYYSLLHPLCRKTEENKPAVTWRKNLKPPCFVFAVCLELICIQRRAFQPFLFFYHLRSLMKRIVLISIRWRYHMKNCLSVLLANASILTPLIKRSPLWFLTILCQS